MVELFLGKGVAAWLDAADFVRFGHQKWRLSGKGIPCRDGKPWTGKAGLVYLPRILLGAHSGEVVRHRNNLKLDCRRENLFVEPRTGKPRKGDFEQDLSTAVLRFTQAFPSQAAYGLPTLRRQLRTVLVVTGLTGPELLRRIDGYAKVLCNMAPWGLENPAPRLEKYLEQSAPLPTILLPEPSPQQRALVRAFQNEWSDDGTA